MINIGDRVQIMARSSAFMFKTGTVKVVYPDNNPNLDPMFGVLLDEDPHNVGMVRCWKHELEVVK